MPGVKVSVQLTYFGDWLKVEIPVDAFSVKSAKLTFKTDAVSTAYIDRMELKARSYFTNVLTLEKKTTKLDKDYALSNAEFGNTFETLHDTIKDEVKQGDIALSIQAKQ